MSNTPADYPESIHTPTDISGYGQTPLGSTPTTHTNIHEKIEEELAAIQTKLGIGAAIAAAAATGKVLTKKADGSTGWEDPAGGEQAYYQYIYNSSGAQSGNRFNNWADMIAAIDGREARVQFEQNETIPPGAWNIDYHIWIGNGQNPDGGGIVITFETGTTLSSAINWICENGLNIYSTSEDPVYVMTVPHIFIFNRTAVYTDNIELIRVEAAGLIAVQVSNGFGLYNDGSSAGHYEVINIASSAYASILVITENGISPNVQNNTVRSEVPFVYGWLKQTSEANSGFATHANIDPGSVNFNGVPGGPGGSLFANAAVIGFPQGKPSGITSDNVSDALAELEARIAAIE